MALVPHLLAVAALVACASTGPTVQPEPESPAPPRDLQSVTQYTRPHVPVITPFPGTTGLSAASCGECHVEIAAEWAASTHSKAWVDEQFQAELSKDPEVGWICLNCHTPLTAQQPEIVTHNGSVRGAKRVPNPAFDASLREEGITCLTCHWREGGIAAVHADVQAPHPTVYAPELRDTEMCVVCHEAQVRIEDALVCAFSTGTEWREAGSTKSCPECHMPRVTRASAPGAPIRTGGRHHWPGSLLPKVPWTPEQAALSADWAPGSDARLALPPTATPGEAVTTTLTLINARAGHRLPTGDPERHYVLIIEARAGGVVVGHTQEEIGQVWEWWPRARKLSDTRPAPAESRDVALQFTMPNSPVTVTATIEHVRISDENAAYHELKGYLIRREVHALDGTIQPREAPP